MDNYSKWAEVEFMAETTARRIIGMLHRLRYREGIPASIVTDNGPQFLSYEFEEFMTEFGIRHIRTPVYHPQANGLVERFNRTLGGFI